MADAETHERCATTVLGRGVAPPALTTGPHRSDDRRRACRRCGRHVWHPCPGAVRRRAVDRAPARRRHADRRPQGPVDRPHPGQDVRPARDRAPAALPRPADVVGRAVRDAATAVAVAAGRAADGGADRGRAGGDRRRVARHRADHRRADRSDRGTHRAVGRRPGDAGVPRDVAALATSPLAGRHPRRLCFGPNRGRAVTYTSPRRWLPEPTPEHPAADPGAAAPLPVRLWPRSAAALRALAERPARLGGRTLRVPRRRAEPVDVEGTARGSSPTRSPARTPRVSDCCPTSMPTPWPVSHARCCSRDRRSTGLSHAGRPATSRSCSSTARSRACGTTGVQAGRWPSPSSHWHV